jgi:hypothetical protein
VIITATAADAGPAMRQGASPAELAVMREAAAALAARSGTSEAEGLGLLAAPFRAPAPRARTGYYKVQEPGGPHWML